MKRALHYFYYKLYYFGVAISDDVLNEWKPLVTILTLEILILAQFLCWYSLLTKRIVDVSNPFLTFLPIVALLGIGNYRFFLHANKWKQFRGSFRQFDNGKKGVGSIKVALVILAIVAGVIISFYNFAQIDWKRYR
ncbi:hypothetical protein SAMN05444008_101280 [Cnuella takakiae]|uniref:Uncharacterized protein n=1 Tax=Cnuella takakiae TaxID=1302690 RepID=A0A1M4SZ80_9BACT|nr:hypothetical protein [Cnuella takakiae]OLY90633.1 hypothetical protein BUE76_00970 [Cnuella takakiae]SHE37347.1 hypothetical protein SAMN05444008_101280 [Cnuella takakiae]